MTETAGSTLGELGEFALIDRVTADVSGNEFVLLGPGDDTAIVSAPSGNVVVTTDVLIEGTHFRRDWSTPVDIGRKAAAASLADIAAMGAIPTGLLVGFGGPADLPVSWAVQCTAGLAEEASGLGAAIVGGDVVASPHIVLSVTALGDLQGRPPVLRSGARPGDRIAIAGRFGWAAAGLAVLSRGFRSPKALVDAHRFPIPPYAAGPAAAIAGASSMIDVSDGLIADARHIASASAVVLSITTAGWVVPDPIQAAASAYNVDPHIWMLTGGEDHALLATFADGMVIPDAFTVIGVVDVVGDRGAGVMVDGVWADGKGGHEHFG
jgi:thiamine-monophosphate kinase